MLVSPTQARAPSPGRLAAGGLEGHQVGEATPGSTNDHVPASGLPLPLTGTYAAIGDWGHRWWGAERARGTFGRSSGASWTSCVAASATPTSQRVSVEAQRMSVVW